MLVLIGCRQTASGRAEPSDSLAPCGYFSTSNQTPFQSAQGAVSRNCSMRSSKNLLVAAVINRDTWRCAETASRECRE